jgi:hypothetical protein
VSEMLVGNVQVAIQDDRLFPLAHEVVSSISVRCRLLPSLLGRPARNSMRSRTCKSVVSRHAFLRSAGVKILPGPFVVRTTTSCQVSWQFPCPFAQASSDHRSNRNDGPIRDPSANDATPALAKGPAQAEVAEGEGHGR